MGFFKRKNQNKEPSKLNWVLLTDSNQLEEIRELSFNQPVLIFKHSTRCSISSMALNRLERDWKETVIIPYFLDLLVYRKISNDIAHLFNVFHESPQVILIKKGKATYSASHQSISVSEILIAEAS